LAARDISEIVHGRFSTTDAEPNVEAARDGRIDA
jgi:hypothetical protein